MGWQPKGGRGASANCFSARGPATSPSERQELAISRRSLLLGGLAAASRLLSTNRAQAAAADEADTSPEARDEAIRSLPLTELTAETRRKLMAVCERPTIFRRLPQKAILCDAALHQFLIRNPEVVVNIWQIMGVASMSAERQAPYLWKANDGAGTTCDVELVYGTDHLHVLYCDGLYEGSLLKHKVTGRCVLALKSGHAQTADRRPYVANRLDLFVQIDNLAADVVARTLSPWVGKVADANFHESCIFASKLSDAAEKNSAGVQRLAEKLTKVEPPVRDEFSRVTAAVQERAALRSDPSAVQRR
jgi:hypothetical protein